MASGDVTPKRLAGPVTLGTTTTNLFTVPSLHQYSIKQIIICNTDSSDRTVSLAIGTAATAANRFVSFMNIPLNTTVTLDTALILENSETLQGLASTASVVTVTVTGWDREI